MKKILFERTGGFMGRKVSLSLDMADLPEDQVEKLSELVDEADFFELPANLTRQNVPDAFTYHITVISDKGEHSVRCGDTTAPDDLLPLIEELEPFRRGWYAAPVGWISANAAHFVVAIRSGLIHKQNLYLYSGAGIVAGSDPDMEWEEIENKLLNFLRAVEVNGEFTRPVQTASKAVS